MWAGFSTWVLFHYEWDEVNEVWETSLTRAQKYSIPIRHRVIFQCKIPTKVMIGMRDKIPDTMLETQLETVGLIWPPSCTHEQQITQTAVETSRIPLPVGTILSMALETERSAALNCMPELILLRLFCQVLKWKRRCQLHPHRVSRMSPYLSALSICVCYTPSETLRLAERYVLLSV